MEVFQYSLDFPNLKFSLVKKTLEFRPIFGLNLLNSVLFEKKQEFFWQLEYRNSLEYRKIVLLRFFPVFGSVSVYIRRDFQAPCQSKKPFKGGRMKQGSLLPSKQINFTMSKWNEIVLVSQTIIQQMQCLITGQKGSLFRLISCARHVNSSL